jgi:MFS family permease
MFDGLEMGLFPLVARPALRNLFGAGVDEGSVGLWYGVITAGFLVGAATGGVLFGWLGDKIGRVRAMTLSVMLYAGCSGLCAFSEAPWHLAGLRFAGALGMGGEWALGVSLVMELWSGASRPFLAGLIGAFGNLGYLVIGCVAILFNEINTELPNVLGSVGLPPGFIARFADPSHDNWRLLMLIGASPAVLTLFIRLFVPESERWEKEKKSGATSHWSGWDLLAVLGGAAVATGVITIWVMDFPMALRIPATLIGLVLITLGYMFPAYRYLGRAMSGPGERQHILGRMLLAAGLSGVALIGTWAGLQWVYPWAHYLTGKQMPNAVPYTQIVTSFGAIVGCIVGAMLGGKIGRRPVYAALCVLSMISLLGLFQLNDAFGWKFLIWAWFAAALSASFYGWLPLYLPELFPTRVRATGQGFGFNFGRIVAAIGALQTGNLLAYFDNDYAMACSIAAGVYVVGLVIIALAPETRGKPLPE